jgi:radical SAM/Cys-rich protein
MTSLQPAENLPDNIYQISGLETFRDLLKRQSLNLERDKCTTLQINVGLLCNQTCKHCHLDAGPTRPEIMTEETVWEVIDLATRFQFDTIDITGGAPEMNPHIQTLTSKLAPLSEKLLLRANLTAIGEKKQESLLDICHTNKVAIVASFPSLNEAQAESQRGNRTFAKSLATLAKLNKLGYGKPGSGLELNLVSNPTGAFLPASQKQIEKRFRQILARKWGLTFNNLFAFANIPLGRFRAWLERTGNLDAYLYKLASSFNPCALRGLMCRSIISVSWDGFLYDCDFNQALDLYMGKRKAHITELDSLPGPGDTIAVSEHCYTCTAGAGFT